MSDPTSPFESQGRGSLLARYGGAIGRDTAIYAFGMCLIFPFSLVQLAILTQFLDTSEYGDLAILYFFSGVLTLLMNLGTLQGTFGITYGISGDDGDGDGGDFDDGGDEVFEELVPEEEIVEDKQLALTTGLVLMLIVIAVLALPLTAAAGPVASFLI